MTFLGPAPTSHEVVLTILIEAGFPMSALDIMRAAGGRSLRNGLAMGIRRDEIGVEWIEGCAWYWFKGVDGPRRNRL